MTDDEIDAVLALLAGGYAPAAETIRTLAAQAKEANKLRDLAGEAAIVTRGFAGSLRNLLGEPAMADNLDEISGRLLAASKR